MFGFSFSKILVLFIILFLVWNLFNFIEKQKSKHNKTENEKKDKVNAEESLVECKKCGSFYSVIDEQKCPVCMKHEK